MKSRRNHISTKHRCTERNFFRLPCIPHSTLRTPHSALLCLSAALLFLTSSCGPAPASPPPPPKPSATIPFTAANGASALARVVALCALGPRNAGTPGNERAAQWLAAELQKEGLESRIDTFTNETPSGTLVCHNVLASIPSCATGECIVLLSHFDTKTGISTNFIGANDGGSSTGLLLEFAHVLRHSPLRQCNVLFGFLDGEECRVQYGPHDGFHGSRRLAAQLASKTREVRAVILLDMIGDRDLTVTLPANGSPQLTQLVLESANKAGVREKFQLAEGRVLDDHQAFLEAGFPAVDLIDFVYGSAPGLNDYWHTPADTLDKISDASLTAVGQVVAEMLGQLDAK